jgi:phospholipid transport system substrate-binding protein
MVTRFEKIAQTVTVASFVLLVTAPSAFAGPATEAIKRTHAKVLEVLHDKELNKPEGAADRKERLAMAIAERFSYTDMARHILARQWSVLGEEKRYAFVHLFRQILLRTYVHHIDRYTDQHVEYLEERLEFGRALVRTKVIAREREVLLDFWLFEESGDWKVYDVVVEGVSLIQNYRGQFTRALRIFSYADLLEKMRETACIPACDVQTALSPSQ